MSTMDNDGVMTLQVARITPLTEHVTLIVLRRQDGAPLPGYLAGAHVKLEVEIDGAPAWRHYSLINLEPVPDACARPAQYVIAVRREERAQGGRGGSLYLHQAVQVGQLLRVGAPLNVFALNPEDDDVLLIAGGIGVTPLASMAAALCAAGKTYALHYSGRSVAQLALVTELQTLAGAALTLYGDDGACLDLAALLAACKPSQPIYVCGPKGMVDAVRAQAAALGWPAEAVRYELFAEAAPEEGDQPFEVELLQSGCRLQVGAGQTILEAMLDAGLDPLYDCKRGDCGVCTVDLVEGEANHRDNCQSKAERAAGKVIQICISRSKGGPLVLDA